MKKIGIAILVSVVVFTASLGIFAAKQSALLGVIAFLVVLWTNEGLPLAVVSLAPIVIFPSLGILSTAEVSANYANPIIFLFLGGFMLAIAVEKTFLHKWMAHMVLSLFPSTAKGIIFALAITSGLLSSVLSNTTTALLLMPIALYMTDDVKLKIRFALSIAYGASVGGILTPIGTPPNLILLGVMQDKGMEAIAFLKWMFMVSPVVFLMFIATASILSIGLDNVKVSMDGGTQELSSAQKKVLYLIGALIVLLFLNSPIKPYWGGLGLNESVILLGFGLLLFTPPFGILEWTEDKSKIPFRIMFLFGAGFSIANAFGATGLADEVASLLGAITSLSPVFIILGIAVLITFTTEITSNTALISVMLPVIYALSVQNGLDTALFMTVATVCASYAFMLPIATPPNAIAMSSGAVNVSSMIRFGFVLNIAGILLVSIIAHFFWRHLI